MEVAVGEEKVKLAAVALAGFRNNQSVFDPDRQSTMQLQGVARLQDELVATETQLNQIQRVSPSNPQVASLKNRVETLRKTIANETAKVAGGGASLTPAAGSCGRGAGRRRCGHGDEAPPDWSWARDWRGCSLGQGELVLWVIGAALAYNPGFSPSFFS